MVDELQRRFGVDTPDELWVEEASQFIDELRSRQTGNKMNTERKARWSECVFGRWISRCIQRKHRHACPGVKGDSATSRAEPDTPETGLVIQVPEYIS